MRPRATIENSHHSVSAAIPFTERPTCSIAEACQAVGFGRTKLYELMDEGHIRTVNVSRRRLVHVPSLLRYLAFLLLPSRVKFQKVTPLERQVT
jgi:excisionase family DNA binding protein